MIWTYQWITYNGEPTHQLAPSEMTVTISNINREIPAACNDGISFDVSGSWQVWFIHIEDEHKWCGVVPWQIRLVFQTTSENHINISYNMTVTDTTVSAYLNVPPPVPSPRLIDEALKTLSIMFVQTLGIPYKVQLKEMVAEEVHCPLPKWVEVHIELEILLLIQNSDDIFLELFNM